MSAAENTELIAPPGFDDGSAFAPTADPEPEQETTPEPEPTEESTPEPPQTVAAPTDPPAIDPRGILRDLQSERQARQEAQQEAARLRGQLEGIQMEQRRGPVSPTPLSADKAAKATAWAHRWGMYTSDGQPDVQAAANALDELRSEFVGDVDQKVNAKVQPVVQVLQQAHAQTRIAEIVKIGSEFGADPSVLGQYASNLASIQPESMNDPNVIAGLIALARGMSAVATPTAAQPAVTQTPAVVPTPNLTETPGRRVTVKPSLTRIEQTIASKRGVSTERWQNLSQQFENMDPTKGLLVEKD